MLQTVQIPIFKKGTKGSVVIILAVVVLVVLGAATTFYIINKTKGSSAPPANSQAAAIPRPQTSSAAPSMVPQQTAATSAPITSANVDQSLNTVGDSVGKTMDQVSQDLSSLNSIDATKDNPTSF